MHGARGPYRRHVSTGGAGSDLVGRTGLVTVRVPGGDLVGEVAVRMDDGSVERVLAHCPAALPTGAEVLVVNYRGPRRVDVEPWLLGGIGSPGA